MNNKNIEFYNKLGIEPFKNLSEIGGFTSCKDLEIVYPYISEAKTIVELGAGYGRCLDFFLNLNKDIRLTAVEKAKPYLEYLYQHYSEKVNILDADIKDFHLKEKVDAILWMFSGIIDFSPVEQKEVVKKLASFLREGGKLVIDIPRIGFKTYADHQDSQRLKLESEYGTLECYIPSIEDIREYQEMADFKSFIRKDYNTPTEKSRTIYILEK